MTNPKRIIAANRTDRIFIEAFVHGKTFPYLDLLLGGMQGFGGAKKLISIYAKGSAKSISNSLEPVQLISDGSRRSRTHSGTQLNCTLVMRSN
jgi:hypothetical protein